VTQAFIHALADGQSTAIGAGSRVWKFVVVLPGAKIGSDCNICSHCLIENDVVIGERLAVKSGAHPGDLFRLRDYAPDQWGPNGPPVSTPSVGAYLQNTASDQNNHESLSK
jgi:acetyltransferase-like isoleucine patch superfamily enzyme